MYEMPASRKNKGFAGIRKVFEKSFKKLLTTPERSVNILFASKNTEDANKIKKQKSLKMLTSQNGCDKMMRLSNESWRRQNKK